MGSPFVTTDDAAHFGRRRSLSPGSPSTALTSLRGSIRPDPAPLGLPPLCDSPARRAAASRHWAERDVQSRSTWRGASAKIRGRCQRPAARRTATAIHHNIVQSGESREHQYWSRCRALCSRHPERVSANLAFTLLSASKQARHASADHRDAEPPALPPTPADRPGEASVEPPASGLSAKRDRSTCVPRSSVQQSGGGSQTGLRRRVLCARFVPDSLST
jgi:hypothetical protein